MALYNDRIKLQALNYAEKNKIVNQKTIQAYVDGFKFRDNADADLNLMDIEKQFKNNFDSWERDCSMGGLSSDGYGKRKSEGHDARQISEDLKRLRDKIAEFNKENNRKY